MQTAEVVNLFDEDTIAAADLRKFARAANTHRAYNGAQSRFRSWCSKYQLVACPAAPRTLVRYIGYLDRHGKSKATIEQSMAAIRDMHAKAGHTPPNGNETVRETMRGLRRRPAAPQRQATPLTHDDLAVLRKNNTPIRTLALVGVMRDAMLRRSEVVALRWDDLEVSPAGDGTVLVRRSKTDQEGRGAHAYVGHAAMRDLSEYRANAPADPRIFPITAAHVCKLIKDACRAAGLEGDYSGHSPRVGMAVDLARAGMPDYSVQQAGRWSSAQMVSRYTAGVRTSESAVAKFHERRGE